MSPGQVAGKRTRAAEAALEHPPSTWRELSERLALPAPPRAAPTPATDHAHAARSRPVLRQETPQSRGDALTPEQLSAELERLGAEAASLRAQLEIAAVGAGLDLSRYPAALREVSRRAEELRPAVEAGADAALSERLRALQDSVLAAFQRLAVLHADRTLQAWSSPNTNDEERAAQRATWRSEAAGGADDDWCGMFVNAQLRAAGFAPEHHMAFNHTSNVADFFDYVVGPRVWGTIRPFGAGPDVGQDLRAYHQQRGSERSWLAGTEVGDDIRPGDVLTVEWQRDGNANHTVVVASYTPASAGGLATLVTIDGNAYGAQKPGVGRPAFDGSDPMTTFSGDADERDVSISRWEQDLSEPPTATRGVTFDRAGMLPPRDGAAPLGEKNLVIHGRGRPSLVDFEFGHEYPDHPDNVAVPSAQGPDADTNLVQRLEAGAASAGAALDPGAAFERAAAGPAGELPYRAEMEHRFGADFSAVRAYTGRDLSSLGAHAATRGDDIAFAAGTPDRQTVAHELTHVLQSRQGRAGDASLSSPHDASEREARQVASDLDRGQPLTVGAAPAGQVQRQDDGTPPPAHPTTADGSSRGSLIDWESTQGIIGADTTLPVGGGSPGSIRELYEFYLLRHLWTETPAMVALYQLTHGLLPSEEQSSLAGRHLRHAAVESLLAFLTGVQRSLRARQGEAAAEALRLAVFRANEHAIADALMVESAARYQPEGDGDTFCNVWAFDMVTALGGYLPRVWYLDENDRFLRHGQTADPARTAQVRANDLYDWMQEWGAEFGWAEVLGGAQAAQAEANSGHLVVILGRTVADDASEVPTNATYTAAPGHVSVVMAESRAQGQLRPSPDVPLQSQAGAQNYRSNAAGSELGAGSIGYEPWWDRALFSPQEGKTDAAGDNHAGHGFFVYLGGAGLGDHSVRPPEETGLVAAEPTAAR